MEKAIYMDILLPILRFLGIFVAGVCGIIGILFETHEEVTIQEGTTVCKKRRLNKYGKWFLVMTVIGLLIAMGSQLMETVTESHEREEGELLAIQQRNEDAHRAMIQLVELRELATVIDTPTLSIAIELADASDDSTVVAKLHRALQEAFLQRGDNESEALDGGLLLRREWNDEMEPIFSHIIAPVNSQFMKGQPEFAQLAPSLAAFDVYFHSWRSNVPVKFDEDLGHPVFRPDFAVHAKRAKASGYIVVDLSEQRGSTVLYVKTSLPVVADEQMSNNPIVSWIEFVGARGRIRIWPNGTNESQVEQQRITMSKWRIQECALGFSPLLGLRMDASRLTTHIDSNDVTFTLPHDENQLTALVVANGTFAK